MKSTCVLVVALLPMLAAAHVAAEGLPALYRPAATETIGRLKVETQDIDGTEPAIKNVTTETTARIDNMLMHALSLIGVKYRFGGNSAENGFDCSGFVRHVFAEALEMDLPRSSFDMSKIGKPVRQDDLLPGDLVFYNTLRRSFSHVAIYLGEGRFVHSPSRGKKVEIVDMSDRYWSRRFNGARRMLEEK